MERNKYVLLVGLILMFVSSVKGQNLTIPNKEFSLATKDSISLEKGSFTKLPIWILRSKDFAGDVVNMGVSSSLPQGVQVSFQTKRGTFDVTEALISVSPETPSGTHFIIISGSMQYKTKGIVVKLTVDGSTASEETLSRNTLK